MEFHFNQVFNNLTQVTEQKEVRLKAASIIFTLQSLSLSLSLSLINKDSSLFLQLFLLLPPKWHQKTKNGVWQFILHNSDNFLSGTHNIQYHNLSQCPSQAGLPGALTPFHQGGSSHQDATAQKIIILGGIEEEVVVPHCCHCFWLGLQHVAVQGDVLLVQEGKGWRRRWIWDGGVH